MRINVSGKKGSEISEIVLLIEACKKTWKFEAIPAKRPLLPAQLETVMEFAGGALVMSNELWLVVE